MKLADALPRSKDQILFDYRPDARLFVLWVFLVDSLDHDHEEILDILETKPFRINLDEAGRCPAQK